MGLQDLSRPDILTVSCSDVLTKEIQTKLLLEKCINHRYRKDLPFLGGGGGGGGGVGDNPSINTYLYIIVFAHGTVTNYR